MSHEFAIWLQKQLDDRGWSARELGRRAGVSNTSINNVISLKTGPTWEFCAAIAVPLGEPVWNVFRLAGLLPRFTTEDEITYQGLLDIMKQLSADQRREVLKYAQFLSNKGES